MSVSLALLPVALALRVAMGKEGFENWVQSMQVRMPTSFENEVDLVVTVRKAGYDAEKWAGVVKTHLRAERNFFFWELVDGRWTAVFAKSDSKEMISWFVEDLESKSGRSIFLADGVEESPSVSRQSFPTNFRDGQLLQKALEDHGLDYVVQSDGEIVHRSGQSALRFRPIQDGPYSAEIENAPNLRQVFQFLSNLDEDYKRGVQAAVYENLISRIEEKSLTVESEEVLEDNSIVITLNVQE